MPRKWNKEQKELRRQLRMLKLFGHKEPEEMWSYLYVMKCHEFYKIGKTFDLENYTEFLMKKEK
jgi:hypothetical protein